jgi:hypothetical protein
MNEIFYIQFKHLHYKKVYKAKVEILSKTTNLIIFKVIGSQKEITLKKHLYRKNNNWEVIGENFKLNGRDKDSAMLLDTIQKAIDEFLKPQIKIIP